MEMFKGEVFHIKIRTLGELRVAKCPGRLETFRAKSFAYLVIHGVALTRL